MAVRSVYTGSGSIMYPYPPGGGGSGGGGSGGGGSGIGGGGSGIGGGGSVWSDSDQIIWIQADDGIRYPIYLKPGWNDIHFWIPSIYPEDVWVEAPIIIEAPGYILIPAGFEWDVVTSPDAPEKLGNQKMADKLKFVDVYAVDILTPPTPVNVDNIIEELTFEDFSATDIINISLQEQNNIDELTFEDIHQMEIELPPFMGEYNQVDDVLFEDVSKTELVNVTIVNQNIVDELTLTDINSNDFITINKEDADDLNAVAFEDICTVDI